MSHFATFLIAIAGVAACILIFEMKKVEIEQQGQSAEIGAVSTP